MLEKNSHHVVEITGLGVNGEGIGRLNGFTLFVERALPGETIEARIVKLNKSFGYGRLIRVIEPSPARVGPPCPHNDNCGGCSLLHMDYAAQLAHKTARVRDCLEKIGGLVGAPVSETIGMAKPWFFRNKAQFPVGLISGKAAIGFYSRRSHRITEINECLTHHPVNGDVLAAFSEYLRESGAAPYDETTHSGLIRHLITKFGFAAGELMVCVVINGRGLPRPRLLAEKLARVKGFSSLYLNVNTARTNVILGEECILIHGKPFITDIIGGLRFNVSPLSFFQTNPVQTEVLYQKILDFAELRGHETVVDAYCGVGTITLLAAKRARRAIGIEIRPQAVADAEENARINGIANAEFIAGSAEEILPGLVEENPSGIDCVIVDPPRKGCGPSLLEAVVKSGAGRVIYVSCDPATLARDLKILCEGAAYEVSRVQPVDMFPHTAHVETVVLLSKLKTTESIEVKIDLDEMDLTTAESKATYDEIVFVN